MICSLWTTSYERERGVENSESTNKNEDILMPGLAQHRELNLWEHTATITTLAQSLIQSSSLYLPYYVRLSFPNICTQLFMQNVTSNVLTPCGSLVTDKPLNSHNLETDTQKVSHLPLLLSSYWMEQSDTGTVCVCVCVLLIRSGWMCHVLKIWDWNSKEKCLSPYKTHTTSKQIPPVTGN